MENTACASSGSGWPGQALKGKNTTWLERERKRFHTAVEWQVEKARSIVLKRQHPGEGKKQSEMREREMLLGQRE